MARHIKTIAALASVLFALSGCGDSGGGNPTGPSSVSVQLTKATATTTAYAVSQMTVTLQNTGGGTPLTAVTNTSGIATFTGITAFGTYEVTKVSGLDVSGGAVNDEGREFVKAAPITTATPLIDYSPVAHPSVSVTAGGTFTLNAPVPAVRTVTVIQKGTLLRDRAGASSPVSATEGADFAGRVTISSIGFSSPHADGILFYGADGSTHMTLQVQEASSKINNIFYAGAHDLGDVATTKPFGTIRLEVPSATDWAFTAPSPAGGATTYQNANATYTFGLLDTSTLWFSNFSVPGSASITFSWEIQRFELIP